MADFVAVDDHFERGIDPRWVRTQPGGGALTVAESVLRLALPSASAGVYSDAQIDDYGGLPRSQFPWRPPLRMTVRARASHPVADTSLLVAPDVQPFLRGTIGFGFWNYPFSLRGSVLRLPDALWFFGASPPSNLALVPGQVGWGWKAQIVHAQRWGAYAAALPTLGAMLAGRVSGRRDAAARWVQRVSGASEATLAASLRDWRNYTIDWRTDAATFYVDEEQVLVVRRPPQGPLGFVAWIDNQYAVATPRGEFGFGTLASDSEWLELNSISIHPT